MNTLIIIINIIVNKQIKYIKKKIIKLYYITTMLSMFWSGHNLCSCVAAKCHLVETFWTCDAIMFNNNYNGIMV